MKKISIVIDLEDMSDEEILSLVHLLKCMPKKMSQTISDVASTLTTSLDEKVKTKASERARKAANARWAKQQQQPQNKIPKELSSLIQMKDSEIVPEEFDCRDILEGNYPGGDSYVEGGGFSEPATEEDYRNCIS